MFKEYFKIAVKSLRTRKLRSWLTIAGIVIGVFLIVSLFSLSEGIKATLTKQLKMMGGDLIMVVPGELSDIITTMIGAAELSDTDIKAIEKSEGVDLIIPMKYKAQIVRHEGEQKSSLIYSVPFEESLAIFTDQLGWALDEGDWPVAGKREVIVGSLIPEEIFPGLEVGDELIMKGRPYKVVGVLVSLGSKQDDQMVGMDKSLYSQITGEREDTAPVVMVTIEKGYTVDEVANNIKVELDDSQKRRRGQGEETASYSVITTEKIAGVAGNILAVVELVVFMFASIGILVGGIGIMNTMYTSVRERTKEIGIMKAIGAKNSTITWIFLIESGIIGFIGGMGGTVLGLGLAKIIEIYGQVHPVLYIEASVSPFVALFGLSFSFLVGCLAGLLPARSASKLKPVDALRYE
jgi:putative ABC transport system permease protein